jgi:hypothetical protein
LISKILKHNFDNPKKIRKLFLEKIKDREARIEQEDNAYVWKGYNSIQEEQELIKRGYVLLIPYKRKRCEEFDEEKTRVIPIVNSIPQKDGL